MGIQIYYGAQGARAALRQHYMGPNGDAAVRDAMSLIDQIPTNLAPDAALIEAQRRFADHEKFGAIFRFFHQVREVEAVGQGNSFDLDNSSLRVSSGLFSNQMAESARIAAIQDEVRVAALGARARIAEQVIPDGNITFQDAAGRRTRALALMDRILREHPNADLAEIRTHINNHGAANPSAGLFSSNNWSLSDIPLLGGGWGILGRPFGARNSEEYQSAQDALLILARIESDPEAQRETTEAVRGPAPGPTGRMPMRENGQAIDPVTLAQNEVRNACIVLGSTQDVAAATAIIEANRAAVTDDRAFGQLFVNLDAAAAASPAAAIARDVLTRARQIHFAQQNNPNATHFQAFTDHAALRRRYEGNLEAFRTNLARDNWVANGAAIAGVGGAAPATVPGAPIDPNAPATTPGATNPRLITTYDQTQRAAIMQRHGYTDVDPNHQYLLQQFGYSTGNRNNAAFTADANGALMDGFGGPATLAAVKAFQRAEGLPETGALDEATVARLSAPQGTHPRTPTAPTATTPTATTPDLATQITQAQTEVNTALTDQRLENSEIQPIDTRLEGIQAALQAQGSTPIAGDVRTTLVGIIDALSGAGVQQNTGLGETMEALRRILNPTPTTAQTPGQ